MLIDFKILLLAFAVSIDGFGVGVACGIRKLVILPASLLIICLSSSGAVAVSMFTGQSLLNYFSAEFAARAGGMILLLMGLYFIIQSVRGLWQNKKNINNKGEETETVPADDSKRFAGSITRDPEKADVDKSGTLSAKESLVLGVALGADAFGAGFGAVLAGLSPVLTVIAVGLVKLILVPAGVQVGKKIISIGSYSDYAPILSGLILMIIGIMVFV